MKVVVYGTVACPWCHKAKDFFEDHDIEFEDVDVGADRARAQEMIKKSGQSGVPVVSITDDAGTEHVIIGFNESKIRELLKIK